MQLACNTLGANRNRNSRRRDPRFHFHETNFALLFFSGCSRASDQLLRVHRSDCVRVLWIEKTRKRLHMIVLQKNTRKRLDMSAFQKNSLEDRCRTTPWHRSSLVAALSGAFPLCETFSQVLGSQSPPFVQMGVELVAITPRKQNLANSASDGS